MFLKSMKFRHQNQNYSLFAIYDTLSCMFKHMSFLCFNTTVQTNIQNLASNTKINSQSAKWLKVYRFRHRNPSECAQPTLILKQIRGCEALTIKFDNNNNGLTFLSFRKLLFVKRGTATFPHDWFLFSIWSITDSSMQPSLHTSLNGKWKCALMATATWYHGTVVLKVGGCVN